MLKVKLFYSHSKIINIFKSLIKKCFCQGWRLLVEEKKGACQLRAQVLRATASRVGPLTLRLREGAHYFQARAHSLWGLVNDTTPERRTVWWRSCGNVMLLLMFCLSMGGPDPQCHEAGSPPPRRQTPLQAPPLPLRRQREIQSTTGRYAFYWNAYLLSKNI